MTNGSTMQGRDRSCTAIIGRAKLALYDAASVNPPPAFPFPFSFPLLPHHPAARLRSCRWYLTALSASRLPLPRSEKRCVAIPGVKREVRWDVTICINLSTLFMTFILQSLPFLLRASNPLSDPALPLPYPSVPSHMLPRSVCFSLLTEHFPH